MAVGGMDAPPDDISPGSYLFRLSRRILKFRQSEQCCKKIIAGPCARVMRPCLVTFWSHFLSERVQCINVRSTVAVNC